MSERAAPDPAPEQSSAVPVLGARATMIFFAVVVGVILWFLTDTGRGGGFASGAAHAFEIGFLAWWTGALAFILVLERRLGRIAEPVRRTNWIITGSAVAESTVVAGGAASLATGSWVSFLAGVGLLLFSFALLPVRPGNHGKGHRT